MHLTGRDHQALPDGVARVLGLEDVVGIDEAVLVGQNMSGLDQAHEISVLRHAQHFGVRLADGPAPEGVSLPRFWTALCGAGLASPVGVAL